MLPTVIACLLVAQADAPKAKPDAVLMNKAKDIHVVTCGEKSILAYFQKNRVIVGGVLGKELAKLLAAKKPLEKFFVNYASYNDDREKESLFGTSLTIAPPSPAVKKLLAGKGKEDGTVTLILRADGKKAGLHHVVGYTDRLSVGFFADEKKNVADGFSQRELRFKGKAKE